jgi:hypothetical protein
MYATDTSTDYIKLQVSSGTPNVDYYCAYLNLSSNTVEESDGNTSTTGSLIPFSTLSPNQVQTISIFNTTSSTGSVLVTVVYNNGTDYVLFKITLPIGYTLTYTCDGAGWQVYDNTGKRL